MRMLLLGVALASVLTPVGARASTAEDAAAIEAASRAFSLAFVEGDTAAIRDLYTRDAVLLPPGRTLRGPSAAVGWFAPRAGRENLRHAMDSEELRVDGDVAFDVGRWRHAWRQGESSGENEGQYFVVWRRGDDGKWRMEFDVWHRPDD